MSTNKKVSVMGSPIVSERIGASIVLAGHLVAESAGKVGINAVAGLGQKLFALKKLTIAGGIDTPYAVGETVRYGAYHSGQEVSALVAPSALAIADGDPVTSNGDGTLKKGTSATAIGYAMESIDNSGGATVARLHIRVA